MCPRAGAHQQVIARVALRGGAPSEEVLARARARVEELCPDALRVESTADEGVLRLVVVVDAPDAQAAIHRCRPRVTLAVAGLPGVEPGPGALRFDAVPALG